MISITEPLASDESVEGVESVMPKSADDQREILNISDVVLFVKRKPWIQCSVTGLIAHTSVPV